MKVYDLDFMKKYQVIFGIKFVEISRGNILPSNSEVTPK